MQKMVKWKYAELPINDEDFYRIEEFFGFNLPKDLKEILVLNNAGSPSLPEFYYKDESGCMELGLMSALLDFSSNSGSSETPILAAKAIRKEFDIPYEIIPFGIDGGGNYTCLDYRQNANEPKVVYFVHDDGAEEPLYWVADSFTEFLNKLFDSEDEDQEPSE